MTLLTYEETDVYSVHRVYLRCDILDTFDNGINGRFKKLFHLFPEGVKRSDWTSGAKGTTHPCKLNVPLLTPQLVSVSRVEPNLTNWGLLPSEKILFNPVSKLSAKSAMSCSLSKMEFLNLSKGENEMRN